MKIFSKLLIPIFVGLSFAANAQMTIERDSLFGNEWINYAQTYVRIPISADGVYRLSTANLTAVGVPASVTGNRFQIFLRGREVPIYTSTNNAFGGADFIEFYGRKNRGEMDSLMFAQGTAAMLNPELSIYNDTISYFLTWNTTGTNKRVAEQLNVLTNLPAQEAWFWHTEQFVGNEQSTKPEMGSGVYLPEFTNGEGYGSFYALNRSLPFTTKFKADGQPAQVKIRWTGELLNHFTTIKVNDEEIGRDTTSHFGVRNRTIDLAANKVGATITVSLKGEADATDWNSVGTASLRYARLFNFDNKNSFEFPIAASETVKYLEISNFNAGTLAPILYDLTNNLRITTTLEGGKVKVALPPSVSDRTCILIATNAITVNPTVKAQLFTDLRTDAGDYIIISSSRHITDGGNNVKQYADYRTTVAGGRFKPTIIDVEQLYHQFGYGIARHPMGIRNFTQFVKKKWANPRYIVLIGKAREYRTGNFKTDLSKVQNHTFDVPTWGYPGSDVLLASTRQSDEPLISIGRIAITAPSDLKIYLDKVKEYESNQQTAPQSIEKRDWFKNIMHLSGGAAEAPTIAANMNAFKNIIEKSKFGASVTTFGKSNLDPVQTAQNDQIFDRMNKGVSVITFYGHSSASILDFDINVPSNMKNKGKYPVFIALGCSAANMHQDFASIGETFNLYADKGTTAFIGTTGSSFLHSLNVFATEYYNNLGEKMYGETVGNIVKKTIQTYSTTSDQTLRSVIQEFVINGDPALRYNVGPGSDYVTDEKTFQLEPNVLNAQLDSFNVSVAVTNIGTAGSDSMNVLFRQQLPNGLIYDLKPIRIKTPQYRTNLTVRLPMPQKVVVVGQNRLHIRVDADNEIAELPSAGAESNNDVRSSTGELGLPFYILENNAKPVYPAEFAIVGKTPIVLKASTSDALAKSQNYIIQIDTTEQFNSYFKQSTVITQKGGVLKWTPNVSWRDSSVYYWRVSIDSTSPQTGFAWQARSFTYIKDQEGWGQSHYYQFTKNDYTTLNLNASDRKFAFASNINTVEIRYDYPSGLSPTFIPTFLVNSYNYTGRNWSFLPAGVYVTVFDEPTGIALKRKSIYTNFGLPHPQDWDINSYIFNTSDAAPQTGRKGLIDFLKVIPEKSYVQIFTVQQDSARTYYPERWAADSLTLGTNIFKELEAEGATRVRELATVGSKPYSFVYQKGRGLIGENRGERFLNGAPLFFSMANRWHKGGMESKAIGPVAEWKTFEINYDEAKTTGSGDTLSFDIIGMTAAEKGTETVLMQNIRVNTPLSSIDAREYPYVKLRYNAKDSVQRTSPQLLAWRVLYRGLPDLAVNPNLAFSFSKDTIVQGEKISVNVAVENITEINADSVTIQWTLRDQSNNETSVNQKFAPLSKNANFNVPITLDSKAWVGRYNFEFTVNPRNAQPELYGFNNYLQKPFIVTKDKKRPLLDVHIDGIRVVPNGIISPRPTISVSLIDDNPYLKLNDTSVLALTLQYPNGIKKTISFNDPTVRFSPATATNQNKASVEFKPIFTEDGIYQLSVKGKDMSGNSAGDVDYAVSFQVITKSSISNILNYPNPFSTRTQFVYTLTGEAPPQYFRIQIMTISGKVVREITQDEIGALKIGTHKTDYAWDGRDEYGNQLANGVYLYRIVAKGKDGKAFEAYEGDKTNELFKKGIGKLVILR